MAAQTTQSATSSGVSGVKPSYTFAALSRSPPKRTRLNSVPPTNPGFTSVTLMGFPRSSSLSVLASALSACVAAVTMFVYSILLLITNRRYLPDAIQIRSYRVGALVFAAAFFGVLSAITIVDQVGDLV